jgi:hypothetical protein
MNELELLSRYGKVQPIDPRLIDETIRAIPVSPEVPGGRSDGRDRPRRRRVSRLLLVGSSVAASVATAAVLVGTRGGSSPSHPAPEIAQSAPDVLTAAVLERSLAALETARGYVEHVVQQDSSGIRISWRGPNQLLDEVPGQSATLSTWAAGSETVLNIDYLRRTWSKSTIPAPQSTPQQSGGSPPLGAYLFSSKSVNGPEPTAASIAALFRLSGVDVTGKAPVDGVSTYELQIPARDPDGKLVNGKAIIAWVDASTYLPVRIGRGLPAGRGPNNGAAITTPAWTEDFTWEPATPQALTVFDLEPPALFQQISGPGHQ